MKRLLSAVLLSIALVSCGGATARFSVEYLRASEQQKKDLPAALQRMMDGRVQAMQKKLISQAFTPSADGGTMTVTLSDTEAVDQLKGDLALPFSFDLMKQAPEGEKGDIQTEKYGNFSSTGLTADHVDWVDARLPPAGGKTSIDIIFTPGGRAILLKVFSENKGKLIGIFVRGRLMSLKKVEETESGESIVIDNVPSASVAGAFADDVNVSIHTKLTPL